MTAPLSGSPAWTALLNAFAAAYCTTSSGGCTAIEAHRARVCDLLSAVMAGDPDIVTREPATKPVVDHLASAIKVGRHHGMGPLCVALGDVADALTWEHGYASVPAPLARKYAYCEVLGPRGPIPCADMILGFVLFAPATVYAQHSHTDIQESYIAISGAWSQNGLAVHAPGSLVFNPPGYEHSITTDRHQPCLLGYAWIGPHERLVMPGMSFTVE
jgi:dimethylpropiothetin dethiomethylase